VEEHGLGKRAIDYERRDWLFSRQRYWGEPCPIVWEDGKHRALDEKELPVVPPALDDYKPTGTGEPPLAKAKEWIRYSVNALRETNTMRSEERRVGKESKDRRARERDNKVE